MPEHLKQDLNFDKNIENIEIDNQRNERSKLKNQNCFDIRSRRYARITHIMSYADINGAGALGGWHMKL